MNENRSLWFLAHLAEVHGSLCHGAAPVVRRQLFPLNDFFSRTTRPGPFWGPIRSKIRKIW